MSRFIGTGREAKRTWHYARGFDPVRGRVRCCYCDVVVYLRCSLAWKSNGRAATLDHVVPGGGHGHDNLVVCCHRCNFTKGSRTPWEWALADGPWDASRRALRQIVKRPTWAGLEYARGRYGLFCARGAESEAEPQGKPRAWTAPHAVWPTRTGSRGGATAGRSYGPHVHEGDSMSPSGTIHSEARP